MKLEMLKQRFGDKPFWGIYYKDRADHGWQSGMTLAEAEEGMQYIKTRPWTKRGVLYFAVEMEVYDDLD